MLNQHFHWNKARMDCLVGMEVALFFFKETINLTKFAKAFPGKAKADSHYRRIQRFISDPHAVGFDRVARFVMKLFGFLDTDYYLTFDRTNWQWGKTDINILMLAVVYKGIAIPVYWLLLNKQGNSSTRERIALLKRFVREFGKGRIIKFLADRDKPVKRGSSGCKAKASALPYGSRKTRG